MNHYNIETLATENSLCKYTFEEIKEYITIQQTISLDSIIYLSEESLENLKNSSLKLTIKRLTAANGIFTLKIIFLASKGNYILRYWDDTNEICIDEGVKGIYKIDCANNSSVYIGKNTTSNGVHIICIESNVEIGEDCMFSDGILLQSTDQHGVVDIKKKEIINMHKRFIQIQNHVWLARNSTIMPDVTIGEGSIVSLGAVVVKDVPKASIAAGVPAQIVKREMTWSRFRKNFDNYSRMLIDSEGEADG